MQALYDMLAPLPIELFILIGTFIEELLSPIPSVAILTPAGLAASAQQLPVWYVGVLAVLAGAARVPAALILYAIAALLQKRLFSTKRRRIFGVTQRDMQQLQAKIADGRHHWALFGMWALPIFPGAPLSLACGFLKLPLRLFIPATFFGSIINALFYLYVGYFGLHTLEALAAIELYGQLIIIVLFVALVAWLWWRRYKRRA